MLAHAVITVIKMKVKNVFIIIKYIFITIILKNEIPGYHVLNVILLCVLRAWTTI